jgi:hypothetical protein
LGAWEKSMRFLARIHTNKIAAASQTTALAHTSVNCPGALLKRAAKNTTFRRKCALLCKGFARPVAFPSYFAYPLHRFQSARNARSLHEYYFAM